MARVRIRCRDIHADRLPNVCIVCGGEGPTRIRKKFVVAPQWAGIVGVVAFLFGNLLGLIIYIIVIENVKKRISARLPVCNRHRGYFRKRAIWKAFLTSLIFIIPVAVVVALGVVVDDPDKPTVLILSGIVSFVSALIPIAIIVSIIHNSGICAKDLDDRVLTLSGVHENFASALHEPRDGWDDDFDREVRPRHDRREARDLPPERREGIRERPDDNERPRRRRTRADDDLDD